MLTIQFLCPLPNGLHARPAWELKEQCSQWQSEVIFLNHRQNARADAKSSLALFGRAIIWKAIARLRRVRKTIPGWSIVWRRLPNSSISNCASVRVRVKPSSAPICL